ncbi:hypothetical protein F2Q69_00011930 [Brassica cretica]|uniref:Uncharacterized protein n=1 Tax=Brassica cretica TaxID=69181 RepID=A0A8S9QLV0_BRACR|nr:hypothetical protein F2Q69_00011930 [Brassica cretica]
MIMLFVNQSQREKQSQQAATTIMSSCFEGRPSATSLLEAVQATQTSTLSQDHHSLTNTQANNLLGTHDLNTRLRVGNSLVNVYFRNEFKLNLPFIRHEFAVDLLIDRHEFTKTHLWLGMSLQKLSFH